VHEAIDQFIAVRKGKTLAADRVLAVPRSQTIEWH
jgi:hypothetical protein